MKKLISGIVLITNITYSGFSLANEKYDLKCTLDDGEQMTVSHVSDTVYIAFLAPGDDPDEGGSVIKLDVSSGSVKQELTEPGMKYPYFTLTGTDEEIDGKVIIDYSTDENMNASASFSHIDGKGNSVSKSYCKSKTIEISGNLTEKGIINTKPTNNSANNIDSINKAQPKEPPYGLTVNAETIKQGVSVPYGRWKYEIRSNVDGLTVKNVTVNRGKCKVIWYTNPNN
ncbi:hypothetical protein K7H40_004563, partial [Salmonella enterica subsp. enterica serovar Manhattan]|nr:hypothetical protein [Salmonella enterica subsp. enterica serovar Manhattan]